MVATIRKSGWALNFDSGDHGLHVAAIVEQRRQAGQLFSLMRLPSSRNGDPAAQHRGDQRRRHVAELRFAFDHGRDEKILRPGVHSGLHDVNFSPQPFRGGMAWWWTRRTSDDTLGCWQPGVGKTTLASPPRNGWGEKFTSCRPLWTPGLRIFSSRP